MKKAFICSADYLDKIDFRLLLNEIKRSGLINQNPSIFVLGSQIRDYEYKVIIDLFAEYFDENDYRFFEILNLDLKSDLNLSVVIFLLNSYGYNSFISFNDDKVNEFLFDGESEFNKIEVYKGDNFTAFSVINEINFSKVIDIIHKGNLNYTQRYEVSKILSYIEIEPENKKKLYIDISTLVHFDHATGIQRVVKELAKQIMSFSLPYECKLIYSYPKHDHFYEVKLFEDKYKAQLSEKIEDHMIDFFDGDKILFLDLHLSNAYTKKNIIQSLQLKGIKSYFVVYDLLPVSHPHCFVQELVDDFNLWLDTVASSSGAICISNDVKVKLEKWINSTGTYKYPHFSNDYFYLGADFDVSNKQNSLLPKESDVIEVLIKDPDKYVYLMVGTVEPRKGHKDVLDAFEQLWKDGSNHVLVIVGKAGWRNEKFIERLKSHSKLGEKLFWLQGLSDGYLDYLYRNSTCLIAASEGEGFGLPLIEAAQYNLPIIARDIPIFREVAGDFAYYFERDNFVSKLYEWEKLYQEKKYPQSHGIVFFSWKESAENLLGKIDT